MQAVWFILLLLASPLVTADGIDAPIAVKGRCVGNGLNLVVGWPALELDVREKMRRGYLLKHVEPDQNLGKCTYRYLPSPALLNISFGERRQKIRELMSEHATLTDFARVQCGEPNSPAALEIEQRGYRFVEMIPLRGEDQCVQIFVVDPV